MENETDLKALEEKLRQAEQNLADAKMNELAASDAYKERRRIFLQIEKEYSDKFRKNFRELLTKIGAFRQGYEVDPWSVEYQFEDVEVCVLLKIAIENLSGIHKRSPNLIGVPFKDGSFGNGPDAVEVYFRHLSKKLEVRILEEMDRRDVELTPGLQAKGLPKRSQELLTALGVLNLRIMPDWQAEKETLLSEITRQEPLVRECHEELEVQKSARISAEKNYNIAFQAHRVALINARKSVNCSTDLLSLAKELLEPN